MRKFLALLVLVAAFVGMAVPTVAQDRVSIPELLTNDGRFGTLLAAVEAAGLGEALSGEGPFTVLAPTDEAFAAALEALGVEAADLLGNTELLTTILTYHVIPGRFQLRDVTSGPEATTLQGETVQFALTAGILTVNEATIIDVDNIASNGVVHAIDGVLLPPSVVEALAAPAEEATPEPTEEPAVAGVADEGVDIPTLLTNDGRFGTLLAAVGAAGLGEALAGEGPFTVLAPTDEAFAAALEALGVEAADLLGNTELLTTILTYHVIPGSFQLRDITSGPEVATLQGEAVQFALTAGILTANQATIIDVDNIASNGVVHAIDAVLLPPSVAETLAAPAEEVAAEPTAEPVVVAAPEGDNIPTLLTNDAGGRYTTLLAAVTAAGLGDALAGEGPFTVLAPTNDAFDAAFAALGITAEDALANVDLLTSILTYHVLPGRYQLRDITTGPSVATLEGSNVQFNLTRGVLTVNNINISDVDGIASNGVVHAIDGVLLPPSAAAVFGANIRVAHFSPDTPNVDVWVNFAPVLTDVPFSAISDWLSVPAGTYNVAVVPAGGALSDAAIGPVDLTLGVGTYTTVSAVGSLANGTLTAALISEDYSDIAEGQARVTVFHAIEGAPAVNVTANGALLIGQLAFPGTVEEADGQLNDGAFTVNVPAGAYDIQVVTADGTVILDLPGTEFAAGTNYLVAAIGTADAPSVALSATAVAATE
ncbi:MAG: fasciclin domain-containing protein [Pleurocapsa minor GSE-CHR-MK-17-07R]|jgi:uncharacterized surface protein with fasciclin (FAS1) repeats|nr:fasciclin domain-containing protein [Pleurocapsa minor GSE-CHR-MK 17-07R]